MDHKQMAESVFIRRVNEQREGIKRTAALVKEIKTSALTGNHLGTTEADSAISKVEDRGEVIANLTLAYRHLEDASMRLGKAIQAADGGTSVYDKATTVGA